jgi:cystathionine beta-lyase/cystathionine gamma-synthase
MLSFVVPDDRDKINAFIRKLNTAHYAMTLGGYCTSLTYSVSLSHSSVPEEDREKMGITFGLIRVSVGIEDPDDPIANFRQTLWVFD